MSFVPPEKRSRLAPSAAVDLGNKGLEVGAGARGLDSRRRIGQCANCPAMACAFGRLKLRLLPEILITALSKLAGWSPSRTTVTSVLLATKASISFFALQMSLRATDCTRPAPAAAHLTPQQWADLISTRRSRYATACWALTCPVNASGVAHGFGDRRGVIH